MLIRSRAIALGTIRYGDDKLICRMLTNNEGCVSFIVRRGRTISSRHRLLSPLALLEVEWNKTARGGLAIPKQLCAPEPYTSIPYDPQKTSVALFLCEFLDAALRHEPPASRLFAFVEQALRLYDHKDEGHANFHLVFLLQFATFLGLQPDISTYRRGCYFDLRDGCFTSIPPAHGDFILPDEAAVLPVLMRMNFANMHYFLLNGAERSRLLAHLVNYYRLHTPSFPELKSLDVLREVWGKSQ